MTDRPYPDQPAGEFPTPPATFEDDEGREVRVEVATDGDYEALAGMYADFHSEDRAQGIPPVRGEKIRSWLETLLGPDCLNVLARHGGDPVGHATLVPEDDAAYELAIFVLRAYQGAGIGTALLRRLLGLAQSEGIEHVWLSVERWNDPAIAVYRKVGFEVVDAESFELEMSIRL